MPGPATDRRQGDYGLPSESLALIFGPFSTIEALRRTLPPDDVLRFIKSRRSSGEQETRRLSQTLDADREAHERQKARAEALRSGEVRRGYSTRPTARSSAEGSRFKTSWRKRTS